LKPLNWKTIAEFVGILAIVGSLIFVGLQMRQEQAIALVDTYGSVVESNVAVLNLIGAHPDIWEKGLLGDELSTSNEIIFSGMARAVFSHHAHMSIRVGRIGLGNSEDILQQLAYAIYIFPGLRRQFEADNEFQKRRNAAIGRLYSWFEIRPRINQYVSSLDNLQPSIPTEKQFIFWYF